MPSLISGLIIVGLLAASVLWLGIAWVTIADWWYRRRWRRAYIGQSLDVLRACKESNDHAK